MDPAKVKAALESPQTLATVLYVLLTKMYGEEWLDWDVTTIYLELRDDFAAEPATEVIDRIGALQALVMTDAFFKRPEGFVNICNTFASGSTGFDTFDPVTVPEATWTLTEVAFLRDYLPFSYAVQHILRTLLRMEGYVDDYPLILNRVLGGTPVTQADALEASFRELRDDIDRSVEEFVEGMLTSLAYQFNELGMAEDLQSLMRIQETAEAV